MPKDIIEDIKKRLGDKVKDWQERSERRIYFKISPEDIVEVAKVLFKDLGLRFNTATGIDTPSGIEILYHFSFDQTGQIFTAKVLIEDKKNPEIESIGKFIKAALWIEREIWELLGVNFKNHPNLKHLLLIDDWPKGEFPLRRE